jgi:hypothetical protein
MHRWTIEKILDAKGAVEGKTQKQYTVEKTGDKRKYDVND